MNAIGWMNKKILSLQDKTDILCPGFWQVFSSPKLPPKGAWK
jgi:hypothetical protein